MKSRRRLRVSPVSRQKSHPYRRCGLPWKKWFFLQLANGRDSPPCGPPSSGRPPTTEKHGVFRLEGEAVGEDGIQGVEGGCGGGKARSGGSFFWRLWVSLRVPCTLLQSHATPSDQWDRVRTQDQWLPLPPCRPTQGDKLHDPQTQLTPCPEPC